MAVRATNNSILRAFGGGSRRYSTVCPTRSDAWEVFQDGLRRFKDEAQLLVRFRRLRYVVDCLNLIEANGTAYLAAAASKTTRA